MSRHWGKPEIRRGVLPVLCACAVLVVGGAFWVASRPTEARACAGGLPIDRVGAATAEDARNRWAAMLDLAIEVDRPDEFRGSGNRMTAIYVLGGPERAPADPSRTYYQEIVVERDRGAVWRVVGASRCESWVE